MNDPELERLEREFDRAIFMLAVLKLLSNDEPFDINGEHSHTCACGNRWTHSNKYQVQVNNGTITDAEYAALHMCHNCGIQVRQKD
jgi:hypothetical protein